MKTGLFGGTFDPIHHGHLIMAEQAREAAGLDEVWFIPAARPPHKSGCVTASAEHRFFMVQQAVEGVPGFSVSRIELERSGPSYTADTLEVLMHHHPEREFFFILGSDMVLDLPRWYKIKEILNTVRMIGLTRPGHDWENDDRLPEWIRKRLIPVTGGIQVMLSSTDIRERVRTGRSIRFLVPDSVRRHIEENHLYESS
ncbi:nicotinate-nucleotide adenylyltransferase [Desmospora profundinema]|uniref:Probable nicotinate-nucleotide adenylyltransferase n=1 Tax=Desmospora profundinema TaxID=1571184 RepID=A0ABU1IMV6_9BACL|nr:nicotinate-nucleotide adenylyltransferase [Desmospora profundinema]MDR6225115.1 nicotinate-nucleotide adenylyltransferase [Desmospora profundinema]